MQSAECTDTAQIRIKNTTSTTLLRSWQGAEIKVYLAITCIKSFDFQAQLELVQSRFGHFFLTEWKWYNQDLAISFLLSGNGTIKIWPLLSYWVEMVQSRFGHFFLTEWKWYNQDLATSFLLSGNGTIKIWPFLSYWVEMVQSRFGHFFLTEWNWYNHDLATSFLLSPISSIVPLPNVCVFKQQQWGLKSFNCKLLFPNKICHTYFM